MPSYLSVSEAKTDIQRIDSIYRDDAGDYNDAALSSTIDDVEALINSAISDRYTLPVTDTNSVAFIQSLIKPILRFKTYVQFAESMAMPDNVATEYKETMKTIRELAAKKLSLPDTTEKTTGRPADLVINIDTPLINPSNLTGY